MKLASNLFAIAMVFGSLQSHATPAAAACAGEAAALGAARAFTNAARSGSASAFLNAATRFADTRAIALFALGPHRKNLSKSQQAEYVPLAQVFMGRFMAKYASSFNASGMKITACNGNNIVASTPSGRKIIFRVSGGRVQDVNVSSVWLAGQMRSTFVSVINRNGGDIGALLTYLR